MMEEELSSSLLQTYTLLFLPFLPSLPSFFFASIEYLNIVMRRLRVWIHRCADGEHCILVSWVLFLEVMIDRRYPPRSLFVTVLQL